MADQASPHMMMLKKKHILHILWFAIQMNRDLNSRKKNEMVNSDKNFPIIFIFIYSDGFIFELHHHSFIIGYNQMNSIKNDDDNTCMELEKNEMK